jgi:hypothetical protein
MATKANGASYVTVACKVPLGVVLYVCDKVDMSERTRDGTRDFHEYRHRGEGVRINGPAYPNGNINDLRKKGFRKNPDIEGGYALTMNVPKDFWDEWLTQNRTTALVKSKMIFAFPDRDSAVDAARENESRMSGLEPLNPDGDYRVPRPLPGISMIEAAETSPPE